MNHRLRTGLALALTTLVTGCTPLVTALDPALEAFYRQELAWKPCGEGYECATLTVPMDYSQPANGRTFALPVVKALTADPAQRIGSLVFNPGGPGASGASELRDGSDRSFGEQARRHFDIVSFDPRGVAGSKPALDCGDPRGSQVPLYPDTDEERRTAMADAEREAAGCREHSGEILPHIGTPDAARDMDVLRAALGEDKLTYLGWSYGTSLGTTYAELFPHRVRAMVLDGAIDPALDWSQQARQEGAAFDKAVDDYAEQCAQIVGDACPAGSPDEIRALIGDLHAAAETEPLPVEGSETGLDETSLNTAVSMAMYSPESQWHDLSEALFAAREGDGTLLHKLANDEPIRVEDAPPADVPPAVSEEEAPDNSAVAMAAINCLDKPHPKDPQAYWDVLDRAYDESGVFGSSSIVATLSCKDFPVGELKPHRVQADGVPPVMVVSTTGDPATPYEGARSLAEQFPGGMLLTFPGPGHTAYGRSNACVTDSVDAYLVSLSPLDGGSRTC